MKDMLYALHLFTNINLYKPDDKNKKYALCYLPFAGFIAGLMPALWSVFARAVGLHNLVAAAVGAVLCAIVGDRFVFNFSKGRLGIFPALLYYALIGVFLYMEPLWGAVLLMGVFVLARVFIIFLLWDKDYIKEGVFCELNGSMLKVVTAIITAVWLMAAIAFLQMYSVFYFIMAMVTMFIAVLVFDRRAHKRLSLEDRDIDLYVAFCEFAVICEFIIFGVIKLIM